MPAPRDRDDELESTPVRIARICWRLDALDDWRAGVDLQLGRIDGKLSGIVRADEIADAVAQRIRLDRGLGLTIMQKCCGFLFAAVLTASALKGLLF